jgi:hypothetical protein
MAPCLGAVALIYEDEDIGIIIDGFIALNGSVEFVDDRGDERLPVTNQIEQMTAASRADGF